MKKNLVSLATLLLLLMPMVSVRAAAMGMLVKGSRSSVYYYGSDGKRHSFPNEAVYFSWYTDFSGVVTISDSELAAMPLGSNVTFRPGRQMVKIQTDPKVYAVDAGGLLRWIQTEQVASILYGADWNRKVLDISDVFFINYRLGTPIVTIGDFNPPYAIQTAISIDAELAVTQQPAPSPTPMPTPTPTPTPVPEGGDYLIITPDALNSSALKLKSYRVGKGHTVYVEELSQISASVDAPVIDAWIEAYRHRHPELQYVVLVGGPDVLPSFPITIPATGTNTWSDLRYSLTDANYPSAYLPEIQVGRIPIRRESDMDSYLQKMSSFEGSLSSGKKIVFFGFDPEFTYATNRDIALANSEGFDTVSLKNPSAETLLAALNDPQTVMALYYSHGSSYGNLPLTVDNVGSLSNASHPFIYLSGGCGLGDEKAYRPPELTSLARELIRGAGGAAAVMGATNDGGYGYDYTFLVGIFNTLKTSNTLGSLFVSGILAEDQEAHAATNNTNAPIEFVQRMSLIGDPAMLLH